MSHASAERFSYDLTSRWRSEGTPEEALVVLADAPALPKWWPQAYRTVTETAPGDPATRIGRTFAIVTRGFLPYDIHWHLTVVEVDPPVRIRVRAEGDLIGFGEWTIRPDGPEVALTYVWRIRLGKAWMQRFDWLLRPFFILNHNYVMRKGEAGFRREMARRRAR